MFMCVSDPARGAIEERVTRITEAATEGESGLVATEVGVTEGSSETARDSR